MAGFGRACDVNTRPSQAVKHPQILQIFSVVFFFFGWGVNFTASVQQRLLQCSSISEVSFDAFFALSEDVDHAMIFR